MLLQQIVVCVLVALRFGGRAARKGGALGHQAHWQY